MSRGERRILNPFTVAAAGLAALYFSVGGYFLHDNVTFDQTSNNRSNNLAIAARSLESVPTSPDQAVRVIASSANLIGDEGPIDDLMRQIAARIAEKNAIGDTEKYQLKLVQADLTEKSASTHQHASGLVSSSVALGVGALITTGLGVYAVDTLNGRKKQKAQRAARMSGS